MEDKYKMTFAENIFLAKKLLVENIYNTAKLEGVNTTFPETEAILDGVNVPGAKLDDIQVILNLRDAWRDILSGLEGSEINLEFIKKINASVSRNESLEWGKLRTGKIGISGTNHKPEIPDENAVSENIGSILQDSSRSTTEKAIDLALYIMHEQLFWDGNKRTASLAANAVLIKGGAGVLSVPTSKIIEFNRLLTGYYDTHVANSLKNFLYSEAIRDFTSEDVLQNVPLNVPLNQTEIEVLEIIKFKPDTTYKEIAKQIGKTRKTASRAIAVLKEKGFITRKGSDKSGFWRVNE